MLFQLFPTLDKHFSEPVTDLLKQWSVEFFSHLPQSTHEQMSRRLLDGLPPSAILSASPVLSKLSQVLARDRRLSLEIRQELQKLETSEPRGQYGELRKQVARLCSGRCRLGPALAEGSLAVVFPVTRDGREGVAKVLKEGIAEQLHQELSALEKSVRFFYLEVHKAGLPAFDYTSVIQRVRHYLVAELDLAQERRNMLSARVHCNPERIAIPRPWDISTDRVLVMDRLHGEPLQQKATRRALIELLIKPVFNSEELSVLHGDLHGGNLLSCEDGRIGVVDWGLCLHLTRRQRSQISRLTTALMFGRASLAAQVLNELGLECSAFSLSGSLSEKLDSMLNACRGELPEWMIILRKTFHQLEGLLESMESEVSLEKVVLSEGIQQLALEMPFRWLVSPITRNVFASNLSTADLWSLALPLL